MNEPKKTDLWSTMHQFLGKHPDWSVRLLAGPHEILILTISTYAELSDKLQKVSYQTAFDKILATNAMSDWLQYYLDKAEREIEGRLNGL